MKNRLVEKDGQRLILHVITSLGDGGAEGVLYRLCLHDKICKHVVVSLSGKGKYSGSLEKIGVPVHCLNMKSTSANFLIWFKLIKIIRSYNPGIVQTWMYHADLVGGICSKIAGVKKIFWGIRSSSLEAGNSKLLTITIAKILAMLSWVLPYKIILCAKSAADYHKSMGYDQSKFFVITNGYDLSRLFQDSKLRGLYRKELGVGTATPLLGMVARYDNQKDHATLLKALQHIKTRGFEFRCVLAGKNIDWENLELVNAINSYGLGRDLILLGQIENIAKLMNALDVHVLSSAFGEGFPNVIAEAMACGVPCVGSNVGETAAIIGSTGWVVEPRNSIALAESIINSFAELNSHRWNERQIEARKRIQANFEITKMVHQFHEVWKI